MWDVRSEIECYLLDLFLQFRIELGNIEFLSIHLFYTKRKP